MGFLLDTSAWIELFRKDGWWRMVYEILRREGAYTSVLSLTEIISWARSQGVTVEDKIMYVRTLSQLLNVDEEVAILTGHLSRDAKKRGMGFVDTVILATAQLKGLDILTKDNDFRGLNGVTLL